MFPKRQSVLGLSSDRSLWQDALWKADARLLNPVSIRGFTHGRRRLHPTSVTRVRWIWCWNAGEAEGARSLGEQQTRLLAFVEFLCRVL